MQRGGQRRTVEAVVTRRIDGCELGRADVEAFGVVRTFYSSTDAMMAVRFDSILYCMLYGRFSVCCTGCTGGLV